MSERKNISMIDGIVNRISLLEQFIDMLANQYDKVKNDQIKQQIEEELYIANKMLNMTKLNFHIVQMEENKDFPMIN